MRVNKLTPEVEEAAEKLKQLIVVLQNAKQDMNHHHCSVVKKLPPEILSTIFEFYVARALAPSLPEDIHEFEAPQSQILPIPLVLSQVCHRWREVALSTPQIWTTFALSLDPCCRSPGLDLMRAWVSRTRNHALTVHLYSSLRNDYRSPSPHPSLLPVLQILAAASGQWRRFNIRVPISTLNYLGTHMQHHPLLETLAIRLISLHVDVASLTNQLWKAVTTLRVVGIDAEDCVMLVSSAPNLVTCIFEKIISTEDEGSWHVNQPVIEHKNIHHLAHDSEESCYIFYRPKLPNLKILASASRYNLQDMSTVFPVFFKNSGLEKLEVLKLPDSFTFAELQSVLSAIPTITHFTLGCFTTSSEAIIISLLQHLGRTAAIDSAHAFLPNLTSLEFEVYDPDFPWHRVWEGFEHKALDSDSENEHDTKYRPLSTFKVINTMDFSNMSDDDVDWERLMIPRDILEDLIDLMERGIEIYFEDLDGDDLFAESMNHVDMDLELCPRYKLAAKL
ncbi:hypothetical protein CPC08DRAFT_767580 [Agrocybe pediades]|nr:hypothetical protein CPC08DRAFT_767580 [Agrocybe pediades]